MSDSKFYHITRTGKLINLISADEALAAVKKGGFIWLDYHRPDKEELLALVEPLGLHPLSVEDCFDENQIPKVEDYPKHTFVLFNAFDYSGGTLLIHEVDAFIGDSFLVTVDGRTQKSESLLRGIERSVEFESDSVRQGPAYLLHVFLDRIVDDKFVAIEALEEKLNEAEDTILADPNHFNPGDLLDLRRELLALRKSLFHEREILVKICRKDSPFIPDKAILFYRDIYDHLAKFFELTESSRDIVSSLMEMYLSMINNQMAKSANNMNATVRRLTFITTIFMPLTLIAGIGGMSEWSMMTGPENWKIAYPAFLVLMVVLAVGNYYLLKWTERKRGDLD
jgi:magnesium transporter